MRATWSQSTARVRAWTASTLLRACSFTSSANARPTSVAPSAEWRARSRPPPRAPPPERRGGGPLRRHEAAGGRVPGPVDRLARRVGALVGGTVAELGDVVGGLPGL